MRVTTSASVRLAIFARSGTVARALWRRIGNILSIVRKRAGTFRAAFERRQEKIREVKVRRYDLKPASTTLGERIRVDGALRRAMPNKRRRRTFLGAGLSSVAARPFVRAV